MWKRINDVKNYHHVDILFLGSSHAYRGFDNRIFAKYGYSSFNLGSTAQTPVQSEALLKAYMAVLKPKMVIMEVFPLEFESDGLEADINLILSISTKNFTQVPISSFQQIMFLNTMVYKILHNDKTDTAGLLHDPEDKYVPGGFVETKRIFNNKNINPYKNGIWVPQQRQTAALENIIKISQSNKLKFIMIQAPVTDAFYSLIKNPKSVDSFFISKGSYYNFNNKLNLNDTLDFFDRHHLSQSGVEKFDRQFIHECLKNFVVIK